MTELTPWGQNPTANKYIKINTLKDLDKALLLQNIFIAAIIALLHLTGTINTGQRSVSIRAARAAVVWSQHTKDYCKTPTTSFSS